MLAFRRGEDSDEAFYGALLEADYQGTVVNFIRSFSKVKPAPTKRKR